MNFGRISGRPYSFLAGCQRDEVVQLRRVQGHLRGEPGRCSVGRVVSGAVHARAGEDVGVTYCLRSRSWRGKGLKSSDETDATERPACVGHLRLMAILAFSAHFPDKPPQAIPTTIGVDVPEPDGVHEDDTQRQ